MPLPNHAAGKAAGSTVPATSRFSFTWRKALLAAVALLLMAGGAAWVERAPLLTWYYLRGLARADDADRLSWVERVASLDAAAVPGLLDILTQDNVRACANVQAALARLAERWGPEDARRADLAARLAAAYPRCGGPGKAVVLKLEAAWLGGKGAALPVPTAAALLAQAARGTASSGHPPALELAGAVLDLPDHAEALGDCRELVQACLKDPEPSVRARAVQLAARPGLGLLEAATALLADPAPEVRREAMLAARSAPESVVKTESLLRWLHDPDEDVRRLCEAVLRGRNLTEEHLRLGRLLTDPRPALRLQVLAYLRSASDLEPGVWLRMLSIDAEPAVRVAAVRAAVADTRVDLTDRMEQMMQSDPSPTVCQLARYYLSCQRHRRPSTLPDGESR